jgi:hypothetical protein
MVKDRSLKASVLRAFLEKKSRAFLEKKMIPPKEIPKKVFFGIFLRSFSFNLIRNF